MNLSSSIVEKKEPSRGIFGNSFVVIVVIFSLVVVSWGSMRWYIKKLDDKLASFNVLLDQRFLQLQGEKVDRAVHFDNRLKLIEQQSGSVVDSTKLLTQLEGLVVPQVRLKKYEYDEKERLVRAVGVTDNFKYVAQQIISFKSESLFAEIKVDTLKRTEDGNIEFSLIARF